MKEEAQIRKIALNINVETVASSSPSGYAFGKGVYTKATVESLSGIFSSCPEVTAKGEQKEKPLFTSPKSAPDMGGRTNTTPMCEKEHEAVQRKLEITTHSFTLDKINC